jgi:hypothetical protein
MSCKSNCCKNCRYYREPMPPEKQGVCVGRVPFWAQEMRDFNLPEPVEAQEGENCEAFDDKRSDE